MKNAILLTAVMVAALLLNACSTKKSEAGSAAPVQNMEETAAKSVEGDTKTMGYDFKQFINVSVTGIDPSSLDEAELAVLYAQARYCQAMTEADIDTMRELVSEDMVFTRL